MDILTRADAVRSASRAWRHAGLTVGFVPTMGALHEGHLSLVQAARKAGAQRIVVSIFVNPRQFGAGEDLSSYPRDLDADAARLRALDVDLVFHPTVETMYAQGAETSVSLERLPHHLCGLTRPVHFGGVATVVSLLFNIVEPDVAVFGEKDFQQLQVIRTLVRDLHFPVRIVGAPIVRAHDGLALSSRNAYLTREQRAQATCLYRALADARSRVAAGERSAQVLIDAMSSLCIQGGGQVDYVVIVDETSLEPVEFVDRPVRAALAVQIGQARLIDNGRLQP